jgi:hypothetical protein
MTYAQLQPLRRERIAPGGIAAPAS